MGCYGTEWELKKLAELKRMHERQPDSCILEALVASKEGQIAFIRTQPGGDESGRSYLESNPGFPCLARERMGDDLLPAFLIRLPGVYNDISPTLHPEIQNMDGEVDDDGEMLRQMHVFLMTSFDAREFGEALIRCADAFDTKRENERHDWLLRGAVPPKGRE